MASSRQNPAAGSGPASPAERAWEVARAVHRRCCRSTACGGPYEHLREAAIAVEVLAGAAPGPALPDAAGGGPPSGGHRPGMSRAA